MMTKTSEFGVSKRESHDSSAYYARKMSSFDGKKAVKGKRNAPPKSALNTIFNVSSEKMTQLPDNSVNLMVTSPPYNVGKEYDEDLSLDQYLFMMYRVMTEVHRTLVWGGRACINIANIGRKPYIPLNGYLAKMMADIGFLMRGEIVWFKQAGAGGSTAWGSWMSPRNPVLRDTHEYILVFSKGDYAIENEEPPRASTITRDEFLEYTKSVWLMNPESAKRIGHPAPFPPELPRRLIQLYSYKDDIVLDPFMGSGTTAIAALRLHRQYIGYEIDAEYIELARDRILAEAERPATFDQLQSLSAEEKESRDV